MIINFDWLELVLQKKKILSSRSTQMSKDPKNDLFNIIDDIEEKITKC